MNERKWTEKADFLSALLIIGLSLFVFQQSLLMPRFESWGPYAVPALAPMIFSLLLLLCGLLLLVRSLRRGGWRIRVSGAQARAALTSRGVRNFAVVLGLVFLFYLLLGRVHFVAVSTLYIFLNIVYLRGTSWWKGLLIAVPISFIVWYSFTYLFLIPLP